MQNFIDFKLSTFYSITRLDYDFFLVFDFAKGDALT